MPNSRATTSGDEELLRSRRWLHLGHDPASVHLVENLGHVAAEPGHPRSSGLRERRHIFGVVPLLLGLALFAGCASTTTPPSPESPTTASSEGISLAEFCEQGYISVAEVVAVSTPEGVNVSWTEQEGHTEFVIYRRTDGEVWSQVGKITQAYADDQRISFVDTSPLEKAPDRKSVV